MTTRTAARTRVDSALRESWLGAVKELQRQIKIWVSDEPDWATSQGEDHQVEEDPLGVYTVTSINIYTPDGRLVLEPIARNFPGRGIVELYAWPTLFRVRLLRGELDADWQVRVDSGFVLHQEWNRENFIRLVNDLLGAS